MEKFKIDITKCQSFNEGEQVFSSGSIDLDGNNIVEWRLRSIGGPIEVELITPDGVIDTDVEGYSDFCGEAIRDEIITEVIDRVVNDRVKPVAE